MLRVSGVHELPLLSVIVGVEGASHATERTMRFAPVESIGSVVAAVVLPVPDAWSMRPRVGGFEDEGEVETDDEIEVEGAAHIAP